MKSNRIGCHSTPKGRAFAAVISLTPAVLFAFACQRSRLPSTSEIRILIESPPATLEPRNALDANGQRIDMLLFRALTALDSDLKLQPDLARKWWPEAAGKRWVFAIPSGGVSAADIATCIRNYLHAEPASPLRGSFSGVREIRAEASRVVVELREPDPFFPRNASLFRFYREAGVAEPCLPIRQPDRVQVSGSYEMRPFQRSPEKQITLFPRQDRTAPHLTFSVVRDETARLQKLINGEADVAQNSFSATKYAWLRKNEADRLTLLSREGVNVSYLAFHARDPLLSRVEVRRAIAYAIDRHTITRAKLPGNADVAGSFLSPRLPGARQIAVPYDPAESERLLDTARLPRGRNGIRFHLRYKCTPQKDGFETALIIQEMLGKIGIAVDLEVVEPAVFFASIRKGNFQLYSSRWVGVSDASIFYRTLSSDSSDNRLRYQDSEMNGWLNELKRELDPRLADGLIDKVQTKMAADLPYFPLWFWTNILVLRKELKGLEAESLSLSGSFVPLTRLRWAGRTENPAENEK